jgi:hypothetical protein
LPLRLYGAKGYIDIFSLLNEGATVTLIDKQTARSIETKGESIHIKLKGIREEIDFDE